MSSRHLLWSVLPVLVMSLTARADKLILENGTELSGKVTREGDVYTIVTDDGQTKEFHKDQVKRFIYECSLDPRELPALIRELEGFMKPVLEEKEPDQHRWLRNWHGYIRDWKIVPSSDRFVDEWARYTAKFKAVSKNVRYKALMSGRKGSGSLKEYALYPPEGHEDVAEALRAALKSCKSCATLAETTRRLVDALPRKQKKYNRELRDLQDKLNRADGEKRRDSLSDTLQRTTTRVKNDMEKLTHTADTRINEFAQERELAKGHLGTAKDLVDQLAADVAASRSAAAKPTAPSNGPPELLSSAISEFNRIVSGHRTAAEGKTSLHLSELRSETTEEICKLFVGKRFALQLYVKNIEEAATGGYLLTAEDGKPGGNEPVHKVAFHFGADVMEDLIDCRIGARVRLVARVEQVAFSPELQNLERNDQPASLSLTGGVVSVQSGCRR